MKRFFKVVAKTDASPDDKTTGSNVQRESPVLNKKKERKVSVNLNCDIFDTGEEEVVEETKLPENIVISDSDDEQVSRFV